MELTDNDINELLANRKISNKKRFIDKFLGDMLEGGYNKTNPQPERFFPHTEFAIMQGKELNSANEDFPSGLGSFVYKIVERIIKRQI